MATKTPPRKPRKTPAKPRAPARPPAAKATTFDATTVLSVGGAILAVGAAIAGFLARRQIAAWAAPGSAEHAAPDLAPDLAADKPRPDADDRAPIDFRPNMDAPMSPAEREALRPATAPAPSLIAESGTMNSQAGN